MKPKLMRIDFDKMEDSLMFFYPNDDLSRQLQGCLTKNHLRKENADIYVVMSQTKGKKMTEVKVFDKEGKLLDTGHYLNDAENRQSSININKILEKLINEGTG